MKIKILNSHYDEQTGVSQVTIRTKYGEFMGWASLNPEDKNYASSYFGCQIAESRAIIKAYKARMDKLITEVSMLEEYQWACMNAKGTKTRSREHSILHKLIVSKYKEIMGIRKHIGAIEEAINKSVDERISVINKKFNKKGNSD